MYNLPVEFLVDNSSLLKSSDTILDFWLISKYRSGQTNEKRYKR